MSVWWHVAGVAVIVLLLIFVPSHHASLHYVFGTRQNFSGFPQNMFWFYVLPLGFLLTMYTFTGYDASAHLSEETHDAERAAPTAPTTRRPEGCGGAWSTRPSPATSCCSG